MGREDQGSQRIHSGIGGLCSCEGWKRVPSDYLDKGSESDTCILITTPKTKQRLTDSTLLWGRVVPGDQTWSWMRFISMSEILMWGRYYQSLADYQSFLAFAACPWQHQWQFQQTPRAYQRWLGDSSSTGKNSGGPDRVFPALLIGR